MSAGPAARLALLVCPFWKGQIKIPNEDPPSEFLASLGSSDHATADLGKTTWSFIQYFINSFSLTILSDCCRPPRRVLPERVSIQVRQWASRRHIKLARHARHRLRLSTVHARSLVIMNSSSRPGTVLAVVLVIMTSLVLLAPGAEASLSADCKAKLLPTDAPGYPWGQTEANLERMVRRCNSQLLMCSVLTSLPK